MPLSIGGVQAKEALAYWKQKAPVTSEEFKALSDNAQRRAFTVSGLSRRDQVEEVHRAIQDAIEKGVPLNTFKKNLRPLMEKKGWVGKKSWRIENIYRTNMQSAYMAGRYAQMKQVAKGRPNWRYSAVMDKRTRPQHRAMHGMIYPHDHPFWESNYPPNGFACRCTVQSLSDRQIEKKGYKVLDRAPQNVTPLDPITGEKLPPVDLKPDKGFARNVGKDWLAGLSPRELEGTIKDLPGLAAICRQGRGLFAEGNPCKPPLSKLDKRHILPIQKGDILPKGLAGEEYVKTFLKEFGISDLNGSKVHRLPGGIPVVIDRKLFIDKITGQWKVQKYGREPYLKLLARTIINPYEIWMVPTSISSKKFTSLRLLRLFRQASGDLGGFVVFNLIGNRWSGATAFTPKLGNEKTMLNYLEKQRGGTLIYREK